MVDFFVMHKLYNGITRISIRTFIILNIKNNILKFAAVDIAASKGNQMIGLIRRNIT